MNQDEDWEIPIGFKILLESSYSITCMHVGDNVSPKLVGLIFHLFLLF